eukprot:3403863-Alexandrium_andersonii.AAC.1
MRHQSSPTRAPTGEADLLPVVLWLVQMVGVALRGYDVMKAAPDLEFIPWIRGDQVRFRDGADKAYVR